MRRSPSAAKHTGLLFSYICSFVMFFIAGGTPPGLFHFNFNITFIFQHGTDIIQCVQPLIKLPIKLDTVIYEPLFPALSVHFPTYQLTKMVLKHQYWNTQHHEKSSLCRVMGSRNWSLDRLYVGCFLFSRSTRRLSARVIISPHSFYKSCVFIIHTVSIFFSINTFYFFQ